MPDKKTETLPAMAPGAMRPRDAAAYLGVSERTLFGWRAAGDIPAIKRGSVVLFRREDLDKFLADEVNRKKAG